MTDLSVLETGTFVQRILLLDQIEKEGDASLISPLIELYGKDSLDESLRQALGDTLRAVLAKNPPSIVEILETRKGPELKVAIQLASQLALAEAAKPLMRLAEELPPGEELLMALSALGAVAGETAADIFRNGATNTDPLIAAECIGRLGALNDTSSIPLLAEILEDAGKDENYEFCSLATASAINALAKLTDPEAPGHLLRNIHHRNPTVRTLIHGILVARGEEMVEPIGRFLHEGDADEKIMAAGLLGLIGSQKGADLMLAAMDTGKLNDQSVRLSVYDAFGFIPSLKTMICLLDGLQETDEMTLVAVVASLNRMINPGVAAKVVALLAAGGAQGETVARAIVSAQAIEIFKAVYKDSAAAVVLLEQLTLSGNRAARGVFAEALRELGGERAEADARLIGGTESGGMKKRVLAVDDSRSIIMFYKAVLAELGLDVTTAEHGKAALAVLETGPAYDLVITDMNMPEMNGIELTRKIRENPALASLPVVMATTETDRSQKAMADKSGVTGYLVKPIKPEAIKDLVIGLFGQGPGGAGPG